MRNVGQSNNMRENASVDSGEKLQSRPPAGAKNKSVKRTKGLKANGGGSSLMQTNQSLDGNLKMASAASVGHKKPSRLQSKIQSSHSHKEKTVL